ncbi:hypothetical protein LguiB_032139 [Lonicera macranthoides]
MSHLQALTRFCDVERKGENLGDTATNTWCKIIRQKEYDRRLLGSIEPSGILNMMTPIRHQDWTMNFCYIIIPMEATKCEYKNRHLNDPVHLSSQENINRIGVREECGGMEWETFKLIRARRVCYEDECPWMGPINEIHVKVERAFSIELQNFVASWGLRPKDTLLLSMDNETRQVNIQCVAPLCRMLEGLETNKLIDVRLNNHMVRSGKIHSEIHRCDKKRIKRKFMACITYINMIKVYLQCHINEDQKLKASEEPKKLFKALMDPQPLNYERRKNLGIRRKDGRRKPQPNA